MKRSFKTHLLEVAQIYSKLQNIIISPNFHDVLINEYIQPFPNCTVLDVGCGPATILEHLPEVKYFGLDHNPKYIAAASKKYGAQGTFICAEVDQLSEYGLKTFDRILLLAVMHHLDDEKLVKLVSELKKRLNNGGMLITFDVAFEENQNLIAKFLAANDRGKHVRTKEEYLEFLSSELKVVKADLRHDLLRVPYTHMFTCSE